MRISDWSSDVCSSDLAPTSLAGRVSREEGSIRTNAGWWKAPTRFLPAPVLIAVFPPTELSTCASKVVGICTKWHPRFNMAAAKPTRSPMTPPPKAATWSFRSRSEEHTSELQSLMRISYAVFCLKKQKDITHQTK